MFTFNFTNSTLDIKLINVIPGISIVIAVIKPAEAPINVSVKIEGEVTRK